MSDQSGDYYSRLGPPRRLSNAELAIVARLVRDKPQAGKLLKQLRDAEVCDMPDGGMGSVQFCSARSAADRAFGKEIAEGSFRDADGTPVSVTLDIDDRGDLYELDVFKADGSRLISYPDIADFAVIERDKAGNVIQAGSMGGAGPA